jgi:hypothetical protein
METIKEQLDKLAEYQAQRQVIALQKQEIINGLQADLNAAVDKILTLEMQEQIVALNAECADECAEVDLELQRDTAAVDVNIAALTKAIRDAVIAEGASVKGTFLHAVYSKPRVTWDSGKLEGLALAFPPLLEARKIGEASVSIRDVK